MVQLGKFAKGESYSYSYRRGRQAETNALKEKALKVHLRQWEEKRLTIAAQVTACMKRAAAIDKANGYKEKTDDASSPPESASDEEPMFVPGLGFV